MPSSRRNLLAGTAQLAAASSFLHPLQALASRDAAAPSSPALVLCYSRTGTTKRLAELAAKFAGSPLAALEPVEPSDDDYNAMTGAARSEIRTGNRREVKPIDMDLGAFKVVLTAAPVWWDRLPPPMATFLTDHGQYVKAVCPIVTSASSSPDGLVADIQDLCPNAKVFTPFWIRQRDAERADADLERALKGWGLAVTA